MSHPYGRIHRYFVIQQTGIPSSTINLDQFSTSKRNEPKHPKWLMRHCEVGNAMTTLPRHHRRAIERRFMAMVMIEECARAIRIAATRECDCRRAGEDFSQWAEVARDAEREAQEYEREIATVERRRDYRDGLDDLLDKLK